MSQSPKILDTESCLQMPLHGTRLIEASAGTGKTYTIANLYLRHVLAGRQPRELLVVTFTNAATEELRGRIRARLYEALQVLAHSQTTSDDFLQRLSQQWPGLDSEDRQLQLKRLQLALRSMDEAAIFTIHGFCQRALSEYALNSGQAFESTLLTDDSELWNAALKDWWRRQSYELDAQQLRIFNLCLGNLSAFSRWQLILRSSHFQQILPGVDTDLSALLALWSEFEKKLQTLSKQWFKCRDEIAEILKDSPALKRTKALPYHADNLLAFLEECDGFFADNDLANLPASLKYLGTQQLQQESKPSKKGSDTKLEHNFFAGVENLLDDLNGYRLSFKTRASIEAYDYCKVRTRQIKIETASISYDDQLEHMQAALQSSNGEQLAELLRRRFPVGMIDEFQDTDRIQYEIFQRLYFNRDDASLTMIGDPKQAIYSFRGGDIFTYMRARQQTGVEIYSLQTNWRSVPELVEAVNYCFMHRDDAFIYSDSIEFHPVAAATDKKHSSLLIDEKPATAITLWQIPLADNGKADGKGNVYEKVHAATAFEIATLIQQGKNNTAAIGDQPLRSGDIAVLVRTGFEGVAIREALSDFGIKAVTIGRDKVFESEEANGLLLLLQAINHCGDRRLQRAALSSSLLNYDIEKVARVVDSEDNWQDWLQVLKQLQQLWNQRGFIIMFQHLLQELDIAKTLASKNQPERRLTNLLHLSELIQQQSRKSPGLDSLLAWFDDQIHIGSSEEAELRLESDENLVKIVTIHKSKGLEYPIVFIPYLWTSKPRELSGAVPLEFHDSNNNSVIDFGSEAFLNHGFIAEKERLAEDIRLAYVALTRARAKVYLVWGKINERSKNASPAKTALGYLLHPRQSPADLEHQPPGAFQVDDDIDSEIKAFCENSGGRIELLTLPIIDDATPPVEPAQTEYELATTQYCRAAASPWHIASFSSLTRDIHQLAHRGSMEPSDDDIFNFPAGSRIGLLLHAIFEHLDFQAEIKPQCQSLLTGFAARFGFDRKQHEATLIDWFERMLATPLGQPGLSLSSLNHRQRLNELAFDFALDHVDINRLNALLATSRPANIEPITASNFRGLITGIIDLVFEYDGRFYLADYKSNFLGTDMRDYDSEHLQQAMYDRRYDLQLLIYSIALHRYLRQRIPDYDYQRHFGGAYYLFLRAMRPQTGAKYGVHFERPPLAEIDALDKLFTSTAVDNGVTP